MPGTQSRKKGQGIHEINITPFVDVVLVLLVIFMVTTPMVVNRAMNIRLPKSSSSTAAKSETLGIAVTADGQFLVNGKIVLQENLKELAADAYQRNPEVQALLSVDVAAVHGRVIKVMDIVQSVGIERFAFQIAEEE